MSKDKLNSIVAKQVEASTEYWAGKPKLGLNEISAIESYAKKKGEALNKFLSSEGNANKLNDMFKAALVKK